MKNIRKKGLWKKILLGVLIGLTGLISVTALVKVTNKETGKVLGRFDYAIASISTTTGKRIESNQNIVTKDFLSVQDMEIKLDEDATVSYKICFYDEDKALLSSHAITSSMTVDFDEDDLSTYCTTNSITASTVKYFKVVITPAQVDGEAVELNSFNVGGYINQVSIACHK